MAVWKRRPEILLGANIPKPMHGLAPRVVLGTSWWNKERKKAYASTHYRCLACGVHKFYAQYREWLEGHEVYNIDYAKGRMTYVEAVPLCHFCHNFIHDGRLRALLERGQIPHGKYSAIISHGNRVLAEAGLTKMSYEERDLAYTNGVLNGSVATWNTWRLAVFGKEYEPIYKSYEEWLGYNERRNSDE